MNETEDNEQTFREIDKKLYSDIQNTILIEIDNLVVNMKESEDLLLSELNNICNLDYSIFNMIRLLNQTRKRLQIDEKNPFIMYNNRLAVFDNITNTLILNLHEFQLKRTNPDYFDNSGDLHE